MPEDLAPGAYVEEIAGEWKPIEGVPTSTSAFLGETERGPICPRLVTSYNEYTRWFGDVFNNARYMPSSVNGFFLNGGQQLYVCRIAGERATRAHKDIGDFTVRANGPGAWGRRIWVKFENGSYNSQGNSGFRMKLAYWSDLPNSFEAYDPFLAVNSNRLPRPQIVEDFDNLSVDPESSNYFKKLLTETGTNQSVSALAVLEASLDTPAEPAPTAGEFLDTGGDDDPAPPRVDDFQGEMAGLREQLQGLAALETESYGDMALVYAPYPAADSTDIARKIIDHCERMRFRFAVIDCEPNVEPADLDPRNVNKLDSSYAALYAPWIVVADPQSGSQKITPPGGYVLGVYSRTDTDRGVFKTPAQEVVLEALKVHFDINEHTQGVLISRGVNVIRSFPVQGIRIWSARTLSTDSLWKYVSVRRLVIFIEHSIDAGLQWVIFEPNDTHLWARVKDTTRLFLRSQWRAGALSGRTEEEAFFITCDQTTMTKNDILNGRLICEIGIAPVRPAEFVIFRIIQNTAANEG